MNILELVKNTTVAYLGYADGNLWYTVEGKNFTFPVPISDTGDGSFQATDKGMFFMRYIRKAGESKNPPELLPVGEGRFLYYRKGEFLFEKEDGSQHIVSLESLS